MMPLKMPISDRHPSTPNPTAVTVLFTDCGDAKAASAAIDAGDLRQPRAVRLAISRSQAARSVPGVVLVTFDGPARGVQCAGAIIDCTRSLGIEVRCGLHTGECEKIGNDLGGIAVHIGARIAALEEASEILVSSTVKDLVAGSGLRFSDLGPKPLKGVPGTWNVFRVER